MKRVLGSLLALSLLGAVLLPTPAVAAASERPSTPTKVTAIVNGGNVELSWVASTSNSPLREYEILRDGRWVGWTPAPNTSWTDTKAGGTHTYVVRAIDVELNYSTASTPVTVEVNGGDSNAPGAPRVFAPVVNIRNEVILSWGRVTDASGIHSYDIFRDGRWIGWVPGDQSTTYTDTSASPGATYDYTIRAIDNAFNWGDFSVPIKVTVDAADITRPSQVTGLTATVVDGKVVLTWDSATDNVALREYAIWRSDLDISSGFGKWVGWTPAPNTTWTDENPLTNAAYIVRAIDTSINRGLFSAPLVVQVEGGIDLVAPLEATNVEAQRTSPSAISISWTAATDPQPGSGVANYSVYRDGVKIGETQGPTTSFIDTDAPINGARVWPYYVVATDLAGNTGFRSNIGDAIDGLTGACSSLQLSGDRNWFGGAEFTQHLAMVEVDGAAIYLVGDTVVTRRADGSTSSQSLTAPVSPGPGGLLALDGLLYTQRFANNSDSTLVSIDPSTGTVTDLVDTNPGDRDQVRMRAIANDKVWFQAMNANGSDLLWSYDPTTQATTAVSSATFISDVTVVGDRLVFDVDQQLRVLNTNTNLVESATTLPGRNPRPMLVDGVLYFRLTDPLNFRSGLLYTFDPVTAVFTKVAGGAADPFQAFQAQPTGVVIQNQSTYTFHTARTGERVEVDALMFGQQRGDWIFTDDGSAIWAYNPQTTERRQVIAGQVGLQSGAPGSQYQYLTTPSSVLRVDPVTLEIFDLFEGDQFLSGRDFLDYGWAFTEIGPNVYFNARQQTPVADAPALFSARC